MTDDLAKRAVAAGWRWMPGTADTMGWRVIRADAESITWTVVLHGRCLERTTSLSPASALFGVTLPDLTDEATRGCLLALVRETHGDPNIAVAPTELTQNHSGVVAWGAFPTVGSPLAFGDTETEALVSALEVAR